MRTGVLVALMSVLLWRLISAQEFAPPKLPDLYIFHYDNPKRDPFISAEANRTLVASDSNLRGILSGAAVQHYLQTITESIKRELFVGGVSLGDENTRSMTIINGVVFAQGEKIPLPVQPQQLVQLEELARTYGLPLEKNLTQRDSIFVEVGTIKSNRVSIVLPGFKGAICDLPYEGDAIPEPIQLERKRSSP